MVRKCVCGLNIIIELFCLFPLKPNLVIHQMFSGYITLNVNVNRELVPCVRNQFNAFSKLHKCSDHRLKMSMWFGYTFLASWTFQAYLLSKCIDNWYLVWAAPPTTKEFPQPHTFH